MKPEIEKQEITRLEFARMWGTGGDVPDSVKTMLLMAYCEKERAEITELKRIHALAPASAAKSRRSAPRLKAIMIDLRKRYKATATCVARLLGSIALTRKRTKSLSVLSSTRTD